MGGCRCTYRNCTVRTDGLTHMFHYPVFDKVRCHQWLTNAHKLEFLNLKVSQLKNRVICQHHFKYEYFMNFKKDKLTFEAIPTLDGPYCDSSQYADENNSIEMAKMYPISLDDIETEYLTLYDKKANFSVKYGDFLTNCELMDVDTVNIVNNSDANPPNKYKAVEHKNEEPSFISLSEDVDKFPNATKNNVSTRETTNDTKQTEAPVTVVHPYMYQYINPVVVSVEFDELKLNSNNPNEKASINYDLIKEIPNQPKNIIQNKTEAPKEQKVEILSEKKINKPWPFMGNLEPVSPSLILHLPDRRKIHKTINSENDNLLKLEVEKKSSHDNILNNTANYPPKYAENSLSINQKQLNKSHEQTSRTVLKNTMNNGVSPSKSLLKPKVHRDRVAAIEEKRKFNMKLKDIIESCLDKIDEQDKEQIENNLKIKNKERIGTFLSKKSSLPSVQEYTIAYLETRMKRMEDLLLSKVDQNTQRIVELKKTLVRTSDNKTASTQTTRNEENHKKQLYTEISKYLSADTNSLIYEELFINKHVQDSKGAPSPKKRRRR